MMGNITINVRYRPEYNGDDVVKREEDREYYRTLTFPTGTKIENILPNLHAQCVALWSIVHGQVFLPWLEKGPLVDGECYSICSADVRRTIEFMST